MYHPFCGSEDGSSIQTGHRVRFWETLLTCRLKDRFMQLYRSLGMNPSGPSRRPAHVFQLSLPAVVDAASRRAWYSSRLVDAFIINSSRPLNCLASADPQRLFLVGVFFSRFGCGSSGGCVPWLSRVWTVAGCWLLSVASSVAFFVLVALAGLPLWQLAACSLAWALGSSWMTLSVGALVIRGKDFLLRLLYQQFFRVRW